MNVPPITLLKELLQEYGHFDLHQDDEGYTMSIWPELVFEDEADAVDDDSVAVRVISGPDLEAVVRQAWLAMVQEQRGEKEMH